MRVVGTSNTLYGLDEIDAFGQGLKENVAGLRKIGLGTILGCLALFQGERKTDRRR